MFGEMDQKQEQNNRCDNNGIDVTLISPKLLKSASQVSSAAEGETLKHPRGRPAGSKNKAKAPIIVTRDSANALKFHAMEVSSGCDVNESLLNFARRKQRGLTIYLAGAQGQVVGGVVFGALVASSPVLIMAASFMHATFGRLPLEDDHDQLHAAIMHNQSQHYCDDISNLYARPQNLLTNGAMPLRYTIGHNQGTCQKLET
ncbi:hypothetical protein TanjilG_29621 [Lupinus angustifolius]|uniref:PPC domain-containing protein n=1 Tax=Lupinus angustifolius TaxID=3871 RepID=A0A4P1R6T8_LUPAN|nr:hypothetical protein TanjilG_29621 [Lupinus angustifolius]